MARSKTLTGNAIALLLMQLANYVLPFVLIPFLTRALGISLYGVVAFGIGVVQLSCIITDFGFNLSATRQIAIKSAKKNLVKKIVGAVLLCKFFLLIPVIICALIIPYIIPQYNTYHLFFLVMAVAIFFQTFQPIWLFQGIEKMALITIFMVSSKLMYVALVLCFVKSSADYLWVAVAYVISQAIGTLLAFLFMWRLKYLPIWPQARFIKLIFLQSVDFFWSRAAVATYTVGGGLYLGIVAGPIGLALYSAAEQLYKGAQALLQPLIQALFPYMAKTKNIYLFKKILVTSFSLCVLGVVIGTLTGEFWLSLIFGDEFSKSYPVLVIFMITFMISTPSALLGYPLLSALGDSKSANRSVLVGGVCQLLMFIILYLVGNKELLYVAGAIMFSELVVLCYRVVKSKKFL
ncbi:oligosaccharide flippase family protein [Pseudomonas guariconensis]|uniref:oligosaccharide flippase family protein n=1 Tax=Pseudomonas guariconensis TaxID=1288410 RepID=UPI0018AC1B23|nr:oligosaccharide flippase family protein [Pseudomonas guariconensis]MBF8723031.1 oligosaccharide flippase family protein [Pseudomonas guariconensis]